MIEGTSWMRRVTARFVGVALTAEVLELWR